MKSKYLGASVSCLPFLTARKGLSTRAAGNRRRRTCLVAGVCVLLAGASGVRAQDEEMARRLLQSGQKFYQDRQYKEALDDFNKVLQYPKSPVADDALYEIARYQFEVLRDLKAADATADRLLKEYASADMAPRAQVLKGRISLATGLTPDLVSSAIANFDRVSRLYAGTDAVPEAMYYAGEAARLGGRREEAITRFADLATKYPASPIVPRGLLSSGWSLVQIGQTGRALELLQRIRNQFPSSVEAPVAHAWITILYRLYIRVPATQPAYAFSSSIGTAGGKIRDFRDFGIGSNDHLFVATKASLIELGGTGEVIKSTDAPDPRGVFIDREGRPVTIHEDGALRVAGQPPISLATAKPDGKLEPVHMDGGVVTSTGTVIVTNHDQKTLVRFSPEGKPEGDFARDVVARRLAIADLDEVAALDGDSKSVVVLSRDGKVVTRITERGTGYQFRQPTDVAFDRLGHLYVLDRAAVFVFSPQRKLLTTFSIPEKSPGAFTNGEALALDSAARLFVFDGRTDSVQVYR